MTSEATKVTYYELGYAQGVEYGQTTPNADPLNVWNRAVNTWALKIHALQRYSTVERGQFGSAYYVGFGAGFADTVRNASVYSA